MSRPNAHVVGALPLVFPKLIDIVTLAQAGPTSGLKYEVLGTTKLVELIGCNILVTWTLQPTPLEIHLTIDGVAYIASKANPVSARGYELYLSAEGFSLADSALVNVATIGRPLFRARSVKIEAETTGGTVQNLGSSVTYAKL